MVSVELPKYCTQKTFCTKSISIAWWRHQIHIEKWLRYPSLPSPSLSWSSQSSRQTLIKINLSVNQSASQVVSHTVDQSFSQSPSQLIKSINCIFTTQDRVTMINHYDNQFFLCFAELRDKRVIRRWSWCPFHYCKHHWQRNELHIQIPLFQHQVHFWGEDTVYKGHTWRACSCYCNNRAFFCSRGPVNSNSGFKQLTQTLLDYTTDYWFQKIEG